MHIAGTPYICEDVLSCDVLGCFEVNLNVVLNFELPLISQMVSLLIAKYAAVAGYPLEVNCSVLGRSYRGYEIPDLIFEASFDDRGAFL